MGQVVSRISELVAQTDNLLLTDNTEIDATLGYDYCLYAETFNGVEFFGAGTSDHDIYSRGGTTVGLDKWHVNAGAIDVVVGTTGCSNCCSSYCSY